MTNPLKGLCEDNECGNTTENMALNQKNMQDNKTLEGIRGLANYLC